MIGHARGRGRGRGHGYLGMIQNWSTKAKIRS